MEKRSSPALTSLLRGLRINKDEPKANDLHSYKIPPEKTIYHRPIVSNKKIKCPSLMSLCLGVLGKHFEDIVTNLSEITGSFPPHAKMTLMAIARRRKFLNNEVLISLADSSWDILDISGSDVSDIGLTQVVKTCKSLRAVDISRCNRITALAVSELLNHCHSLETLRCGGCLRSDAAVRRCLDILKPKLNDVGGESWEELDSKEIANGAKSLRWLLWPKIDNDSRESLATDCPRIVVNPDPSPFSLRWIQVPNEAIGSTALDEPFVEDIDPNTWAVSGVASRATPLLCSSSSELPIAERFRLAFVERDERLAPKRAKNARQRQRRAEKEWMLTNAEAKSVLLASKLSKTLHSRS